MQSEKNKQKRSISCSYFLEEWGLVPSKEDKVAQTPMPNL
jgi:hypothetical protein